MNTLLVLELVFQSYIFEAFRNKRDVLAAIFGIERAEPTLLVQMDSSIEGSTFMISLKLKL